MGGKDEVGKIACIGSFVVFWLGAIGGGFIKSDNKFGKKNVTNV